MKKCQYCAEDIQDAAIVCKHCGRELMPTVAAPSIADQKTSANKKSNKAVMIVLGIIGGLFILCILIGVIANLGDKTSKTSSSSVSAASAKTANPADASSPNEKPTETYTPAPTELPMLEMDLNQFVSKYDSLTDIQKEDFIGEAVGKWVEWNGEVLEVNSDGTILVNIQETLLSAVSLKGVSEDVAKTLNKGQSVRFTCSIENAIDFMGLHIYLNNCEIHQ